MTAAPNDKQLGEAWEAVSSALRYIGMASADLTAEEPHEVHAKVAIGYLHEAAEAFGMKLVEARQ